jgi:hypothetical protein
MVWSTTEETAQESNTSMTAVLGWALFVFQILFGIVAIAISVEFKHGWDIRNLLGSITFGAAAFASYYFTAWWPLIVGFGLLCIFKRIGLDPTDDDRRLSN